MKIFFLLLHVLHLLIAEIQSQAKAVKTNFPIQSLNSNSISSYTSQMLLAGKSFTRGMSVSSTFSTNLIRGDQNKPILAEIEKANGDIATDVLSLVSIYRNGNYMSAKEYYLNYTYAGNRFHSSPQLSTYLPENDKQYTIKCQYTSRSAGYSEFSPQLAMNVTAVASYSFATFGILAGQPGLQLFTYNSSANFTYSQVNLNAVMSLNYSRIWVIDQEYIDGAVLVLQESVSRNLLFYNITIQDTKVVLEYYTRVSFAVYNNASDVTQVGMYNDDLLIGSRDKGLMVLSQGANDWNASLVFTNITNSISSDISIGNISNISNNTSSNSTIKLIVNDFVVNEKTVYVVCQGLGLIILDLTSNYKLYSTAFNHPSLTQIDFLNNPFLGCKYVGVASQNGGDVFEFFLEFLIDDEFNPRLNKVFTTSDLVIADAFKTVDKFFTYVFDKISNRLIVMRRGMINSVPAELYGIDLSKAIQWENISVGPKGQNPIVSMYDYQLKRFFPALISQSFIMLITDVNLPSDILTCEFANGGSYNITLSLQGEVCKQSIDADYLYTSCDKQIMFQYFVYGDSSGDNVGIIVVIVCVGGGILTALVSVIFWKTRCCKTFDAFSIHKEENLKREDFYKEDANSLLDGRSGKDGDAIQLGTMVDGKVYGNVVEGSTGHEAQQSNNVNVVHVHVHEEIDARMRINSAGIKRGDDARGDNFGIMQNSQTQRNISRTYFKKNFSGKNVGEKVNLEAESIQVAGNQDGDKEEKDIHKANNVNNANNVNIVNIVNNVNKANNANNANNAKDANNANNVNIVNIVNNANNANNESEEKDESEEFKHVELRSDDHEHNTNVIGIGLIHDAGEIADGTNKYDHEFA